MFGRISSELRKAANEDATVGRMILQNQAITKKSAFFFRASRIAQQNPDFFSGQGVPLLWPSLTYFSPFGLTFYQSELSLMTSTNLKYKLQLAILDLALGTAWIFYLLLRKRIKF